MAQITLRKAAALQTALTDIMATIEVKPTVSLNEFQAPEEILTGANTRLLQNDARRNDLLMSVYALRSQVGQGNAQSGISDKLTNCAYIDKRIGQLEALVSADIMGSLEVLKGKLDKIKTRPADSRASLYGHLDEVTSGVLTQEQVDGIRTVIRDLKKQKQKLNDEILELNVRTEIELTPDVETVLVREGLL